MKFLKKLSDNVNDFLYDHPRTRTFSHWVWLTLLTIASAFIFAFGFRAFINPNIEAIQMWMEKAGLPVPEASQIIVDHFLSGGASGASQSLVKAVEIFADIRNYETIAISIIYFVLNIPLLILSWFKISKQFTIFTLLNVVLVSLFNAIIPNQWIISFINYSFYEDMLARCIFGGITTGIASGLSMIGGTSAGGSDIISMFLSEKRGTNAGRYSFTINACIIISYVMFAIIGNKVNPEINPTEMSAIIRSELYTLIYLFVSVQVIDLLNTRNKKEELQIITSLEELPQIIIHAFPHGATIVDAKGAYSGQKKLLIYVILSRSEIKKAVALIRHVDAHAFVAVYKLNQVYGRFYKKPIE